MNMGVDSFKEQGETDIWDNDYTSPTMNEI